MQSETQSVYPSYRYRRSKDGFDSVVVNSAEEEEELGSGWVKSPADHGIETHPGVKPDPQIQARRNRRS